MIPDYLPAAAPSPPSRRGVVEPYPVVVCDGCTSCTKPAALGGAGGGPGQGLPEINDLDAASRFTSSGNAEILAAWLQLAIQYRYEPAYPALEAFLTTVGRRKFLKLLYGELVKTPDGTEMALRIYARARPTYHSVSQAAIDKILDWRG